MDEIHLLAAEINHTVILNGVKHLCTCLTNCVWRTRYSSKVLPCSLRRSPMDRM